MQKAERLVAITLLLQARGKMTAERLASIMEVTPRTIYRDMNTLSLAHLPVAMDYGPGGGYYLPDDYRLDPTIFTGEEAVALVLGGTVAGDYRLFEGSDEVRRALLKLEAALPEEYRADVQAARERIFFDTTAWHRQPTTPPLLSALRGAVWNGSQLDALYPLNDGSGHQWRHLDPHGLVCKAGTWYLVAYCRWRQALRTFRVDRVQEVVIRDEPATRQPGFDLPTYWTEARRRFEEGTVPLLLTLRVTPAGWQQLKATATIVADEPEGLVVQVPTESVAHATSCALSLGSGALVLDPPEVRAAVVAALQEMATRYGAF